MEIRVNRIAIKTAPNIWNLCLLISCKFSWPICFVALSTSLLALTMGLWLDQLVDSDNFKRMDGKNICKNFVKSNFPKQFKKY